MVWLGGVVGASVPGTSVTRGEIGGDIGNGCFCDEVAFAEADAVELLLLACCEKLSMTGSGGDISLLMSSLLDSVDVAGAIVVGRERRSGCRWDETDLSIEPE
jgi:hypothetical protein